MSNNLDDFLNSLGIETTAPPINDAAEAVNTALMAVAQTEENVVEPTPSEPESQNLSNDDFDDILGEYGFSRTQDAEAEEVTEEESGEEEEEVNTDIFEENAGEAGVAAQEYRDLDAEEDAEWEERIALRNIASVDTSADTAAPLSANEVPFHMQDASQIAVPIHNEAQELANNNEDDATVGPLLPQNSPTLLMDDSTTRFSGAEWFNEIQRKTIIIAGQGGIGSNLSFQLARMHPAGMYLYDDDTVEMVNMAGQLYARDDIGKSKVDAIADMITKYTNIQGVIALNQKFTSSDEAGDIMLCGFDNMEARRTFFNAWQRHVFSKPKEEWKNCLFLDGRLSMTDLQVFCITGDNAYAMTEYVDKYLFSDSEAEHTVCSMKQTTYLACMIGSVMTNLFTNWVANSLDPIIPYDLPFFTEYDAQNMIFKTIK